MPTTLLTPQALESVLQGLHDSEIRCGIRNDPPAGGITVWIDYGSRTEKLSKLIKSNALALETKTMTDYDREVLQRHMAARMTQLARLQKRLDHLGPWNL
jgi:hypothetical protein